MVQVVEAALVGEAKAPVDVVKAVAGEVLVMVAETVAGAYAVAATEAVSSLLEKRVVTGRLAEEAAVAKAARTGEALVAE